jgi:hypothetical protein
MIMNGKKIYEDDVDEDLRPPTGGNAMDVAVFVP